MWRFFAQNWTVMKTTSRPTRMDLAAWTLIVFSVFGTMAEASAAVVCVGNDGHADVEYSVVGCCFSAARWTQSGPTPILVSNSSACENCVDLDLNVESLRVSKEGLSQAEATVSRCLTPGFDPFGKRLSAPAKSIVQNSSDAAVSSVVLLI